MIWCEKCVLPDTRPSIVIDNTGICNACRASEIKHTDINWQDRERDFANLIGRVKKRAEHFDCLIPVSGGKDSTWQVVKCLEYGLRPLAVTWKTPSRTAIGQQNLDNLVRLGVDHIDWQVNPEVEKKFMIKSFSRFGATAIPMHMALFNIPLTLAVRFRIPLVVWGENSAAEYGDGGNESLSGHRLDTEWMKKFGVTHGTTAMDWIGDDLSVKEMSSYFGPSDAQLNGLDIEAVFLGHYFKWDVENSLKVARENGFKAGNSPRTGIYDYADIDDDFISIHHWMKWYKFGINRNFDNLSLEIRAGRISRGEAIQILREKGEDRPDGDIVKFCNFTNITSERFFEIAERFRNTDIWMKKSGKWKIRKFLVDDWRWL